MRAGAGAGAGADATDAPFVPLEWQEERLSGERHARARARAESAKIGKHAAWAQLDPTAQVDSKRRQHTDVTRHTLGTAPAGARGAQQHGAQPSEEDQAKLQAFRQARASARSKARGARDRAESTAAVHLAPGRRCGGRWCGQFIICSIPSLAVLVARELACC